MKQTKQKSYRETLLDNIVAWENGELGDEDTIELFQHLIDTGEVWQLQGCYGRTAKALIDAGDCRDSNEVRHA